VFVRWQVRSDVPLQAWAVDGAVAFVRTWSSGRRLLTVVGEPPAAAAAVHALVALGVQERRTSHGDEGEHDRDVDGRRAAPGPAVTSHGITVPFGTLPLLGERVRVGPGDDWDWMWVDREQLQPAAPDPRVQRLAPSADPEVSGLLSAASPRHSSDPGDDDVVEWFGVRDSQGGLIACAAHTQAVPGVPHLSSIATHPDARGQGLGQALTATMCRQLLDEGAPVVTLGMYADNDVARRMYARIGFVCSHRWSSRAVVVRP
jgi:ribosomal protein S18 acetylase RimI-like enzyme